MTPIELREILASSRQRLAEQALLVITRGGSPDELRKLFSLGAADRVYRRDERHPRTRYHVEFLLDAAYDDPGRPVFPVIERSAVGTVQSFTFDFGGDLAARDDWKNRLALFTTCLAHGCKGGSNGYRGALEQHIMNSVFRRAESVDPELAFAKALIAAGRASANNFAVHSYYWTGSPQKLSLLREIGANVRHPGLLRCALRYLGCTLQPGDSEASAIAQIVELLDAGAVLTTEEAADFFFGWDSTAANARACLRRAGLEDRVFSARCSSTLSADDGRFFAPDASPAFREAVAARDALYLALSTICATSSDAVRDLFWKPIRAIGEILRSGSAAEALAAAQRAREVLAQEVSSGRVSAVGIAALSAA